LFLSRALARAIKVAPTFPEGKHAGRPVPNDVEDGNLFKVFMFSTAS
jgi:hypothetical protein